MLVAVASAGEHIECPTCHKQIIVPKAPGAATTKLILRGTQVSSTRTTTRFHGADPQVVAEPESTDPQAVVRAAAPVRPSVVMFAVLSFLVVAGLVLALSRNAHF